MNGTHRSTTMQRREGFTLIELMVVVVVILILLAIAAGIGAWAARSSEEQLTKTTLANTQLIYDELTNTVGIPATAFSDGTLGVGVLVNGSKNLQAFKAYYSGMPGKLVDFANNRINDGWGKSLEYVAATNGSNGTTWIGNPRRTAAYFVSAGPDGNTATPGDNVYSFAVIK